jgi:hypothetical protein
MYHRLKFWSACGLCGRTCSHDLPRFVVRSMQSKARFILIQEIRALVGCAPGKQTGNQENGAPQVAAGENPLFGATDISQGRTLTPEWGVKLGDGTRPPFPSWSSAQLQPHKRSNVLAEARPR